MGGRSGEAAAISGRTREHTQILVHRATPKSCFHTARSHYAAHMASWKNDIIDAPTNLGGEAALKDIYREVERLRSPLPPSWKAIVRRTIETHSSDSENFKGSDVFRSTAGLGQGRWALR